MEVSTGELSEESFPLTEVTWKIHNFWDLSTEDGYYVRSPQFRLASATWCLRLYPNGEEKDKSVGYIDMLLVRLQSSVPKQRILCKIGFKTCHQTEYLHHVLDCYFDHLDRYQGVCRYLQRSNLEDEGHFLVPNGTVTVFCQMRVMEGFNKFQASSETELSESAARSDKHRKEAFQSELHEAASQTEIPESSTQAEVQEISLSLQKLQSDYKKLLQSGEDSDVCLKVCDKEFRAHRCILRARSNVFSSMFKYEMKEKTSGEVVIEDLDPDAFPDFLQHVYIGHVESLSAKNVFSLYTAADKYDVQELKSECLQYMKCALSVDTFCDVMAVALRHHEEDLLKLAIDFFSKNLTKIIVTAKWQIFLRDHYTEANELLIKALVPRGGASE